MAKLLSISLAFATAMVLFMVAVYSGQQATPWIVAQMHTPAFLAFAKVFAVLCLAASPYTYRLHRRAEARRTKA